MVRDELVATIERAANDLELFVSAQDDGTSLQASIEGIRQIVGILNLIEFPGAAMLADELLITANDITVGETTTGSEKRLEIISNSFFALSRYLEYVQQYQRKVPVLLIQNINDLRKLRREPAILESHFFKLDLSKVDFTKLDLRRLTGIVGARTAVSAGDFSSLVRRLRHMYQVGLVALLRGRPAPPALMMMRRSMIRLQRLGGPDKPLILLWWLSNMTFDAMIRHNMEIIEPRLNLLSRIDRALRQLALDGPAAMRRAPDKLLIRELLYLFNLSGISSKALSTLRESFGFEKPPYDDSELAQERQALNGPSAQTVSSLAKVLRTELSHTKAILENAAQAESPQIDDLEGFVQTLDRVAEILLVVGLMSAGNTLKKEADRVRKWQERGSIESVEELHMVADTLLFIDSTVTSLENAKLSDAKLAEANELVHQEIVAYGELAEARRIVMHEAAAGLALTKRALNAYSESDFDADHILNIAKTLNSVRGGMFLLKHMRASEVLDCCVKFVDDVLMQSKHPPAIQELLETFADAIISIEYYLDASGFGGQADESVLKVAEESLQALGYPVGAK